MCFDNSERNLVDEITYDIKGQCAYIRCFGIQFSFHNIGENHLEGAFVESFKDKEIKWDGVKLQPIALELYHLAMGSTSNNDEDIQKKIQDIVNGEHKHIENH